MFLRWLNMRSWHARSRIGGNVRQKPASALAIRSSAYLLFGGQHGERRRVQQIARQTAEKQQRPIANVDDEIAHQQRVEAAVGAAKVRGVLEVQMAAADARVRTLRERWKKQENSSKQALQRFHKSSRCEHAEK